MMLKRHAREFYALQISTTPAVTGGWEASFDDGSTWVAGSAATVDGVDVTRWLLAGPAAPAGGAVAVLSSDTRPLIRAVDSTEVIVRSAPTITLT